MVDECDGKEVTGSQSGVNFCRRSWSAQRAGCSRVICGGLNAIVVAGLRRGIRSALAGWFEPR